MLKKSSVILDAYRDHKSSFLDVLTLLRALEMRGFTMTRRGLSNFVRHSLENKYLVSTKDSKGVIVGWRLVRGI